MAEGVGMRRWVLLWLVVMALGLPTPAARAQDDLELSAWDGAIDCASVQAYLAAYPGGHFADAARGRLSAFGCDARGDQAAPEEPDDDIIERGIGSPSQPRQPPRPPPGPPRTSPTPAPTHIVPALVELNAGVRRMGRNGGSAVVLLSPAANDLHRNLELCRALFFRFEQASMDDVIANRRIDGGALRPIYWPTRQSGGATCRARVENFDHERARRLKLRFGIEGRGPHLLVVREDDARAGVIDLSNSSGRQLFNAVEYFAFDFAQANDVWERPPSQSQVALSLGRLRDRTASLVRAPFVVAASYFASCDPRASANLC
jgi:hypothetical protein